MENPETSSEAGAITSPPPGQTPNPDLTNAVLGASGEANRKHAAEQPRKRGQRGPDLRPRKGAKIPVGNVGNGSDETLLEKDQTSVLQVDFSGSTPFDPELASTLVQAAIGVFEDVGCSIRRSRAFAKTNNEAYADAAEKKAVLSEHTRQLLTQGGNACAKKYWEYIQLAPEGMVAIGMLMHIGKLFSQDKSEKDPAKDQTAAA